MKDIKCPVCGNITFDSNDYEYNICKECYWEYDPIQVDDSNYPGGANNLSLNDYKKVYKRLKNENPEFSCKNEKDRQLMFEIMKKEELDQLINECKITAVGSGYTDLICPVEYIEKFIKGISALKIQIIYWGWWCKVTEGHTPCGMAD